MVSLTNDHLIPWLRFGRLQLTALLLLFGLVCEPNAVATEEPGIVVQPQSRTVLKGTNVTFEVTASGLGPLNYQWQFNGPNVVGATASNLTLTNVQPEFAGDYTVVVTNSLGSVTSAVAVLTVWVPPVITPQPQSRTNLAGTVAVFSAAAIGTEPLSYRWRRDGVDLPDDGHFNEAMSNTLTIADVQLGDAGDYTLAVSNVTGVVTSGVATLTVVLGDASLEAAIRAAISKPAGLLTAPDLAALTSLSICCHGVSNLSGLESATSLVSLDVANNSITDLSPLNGLTNLVQLSLEGNFISNLSPLANLFNLTNLNVGDNVIGNVSVLSGLTNLTGLWLYHNPISSLTALTNLSGLTSLIIYNSGLANIQPLTGLTNLSYLELRSNPLTNAEPTLAGLTNLTTLYLGGTSITNLSFLQNLTRLTFLNLDHNWVADLSPLASLNDLSCLDASFNPLTNITQVLALTNLTSLYLSGNSISNVSALTNLSALASLSLCHNSISDLAPLAGLTELNDLGLSWNPIPDHAALAGLTNLTSLWLDGNSISNLNFIQGMTSLKALGVRYDRLDDLGALDGLANIVAVFADFNLLTNLSALGTLPDLSKVQLVGNLLNLSTGSPPMTLIQNLQSNGVNVSYLPQNQLPTLSVPSGWIVAMDATSSLPFNVSDDLTPGDQLLVTASSSDVNLIPNSGILLSGTNQNRVLTITPVASQTGAATITLTVTDSAGLTGVDTVLVSVVVPEPLSIPDPNLEAALRLALGKPTGALNHVDLISLTELRLANPDISNLTGLEGATNLTFLFVAANTISNLSVLPNLTHLRTLGLRSDAIADYSALGSLTNLIALDLTGNQIGDLSFLESMRQLTDLTLVNCRLTDVAPMAALTNLNFVDLQRNRLTDISPLTNLPNLLVSDLRLNLLETTTNAALDYLQNQGVFVLYQPQRGPPVLAVSPVWMIATNETSSLGFYAADEVTPNEELLLTASSSNTNLVPNSAILLGGTNQNRTLIVTPTANQVGMVTITLTATDDAGLTANGAVLVNIVAPEFMVFPDSNLEAALRLVLGKPAGALNNVDLISLTELHLDDPAIFNLSGLEWATNLTALSVTANTVSNLNVLSNLTQLESLSIHAKAIDDFSVLAGLTNLLSLDLSDMAINDPGFVGNLLQLTNLALIRCRLADVTPLAALTNVKLLDLRQNRLTDISPLTNLLNLHVADLRLNLLETSTNSVLDSLGDQGVFVLDQPQRGPPAITVLPSWIIATNATSSRGFYITDDVTPGEELVATATSSNTNLISESDIQLGGTNQNRTVTVTPMVNEAGTATITLTVTDDVGLNREVALLVEVVVPELLLNLDPNLESAIRLVLGKPVGALYNVDLISLTELHLDNPAISNLSGLEWATNLTVLSVTGNTISNLNVLLNYPRLASLSLHAGAVDDISVLAGLTHLTTIELMGIPLSDLSFLGSLPLLTNLTLVNCRLADVTQLAALTNLKFLDLRQNRLTDITPLSDLLGLSRLDIRLNLLETGSNSALNYLLSQGVPVLYLPQRGRPEFVASPAGWFVVTNATSYVRFSAFDTGPTNENLIITASSSDTNLAPNTNLIVAHDANGRREDWILTVIPPADYSGTSTIMLIAENEVSISATTSVQLTIAVPLPLDAQVLEGNSLTWLAGGDVPWFGQPNVTHDGFSAAQSGSIVDNMESWIETTVTGPGILSFWWKVSSESGYDWLEFYVNGVETNRVSGQMDWGRVTVNIPPGLQTLKWRYVKDSGWSDGFDAAWLDEVYYGPDATVVLDDLSQVYDGLAKSVSATTGPGGLTVSLTYDGSASAPTNAGSYVVIGTVVDPYYLGATTNTLTITKASATATLGDLNSVYDGAAHPGTVSTTPTGLSVNLTYNGSPNAPTNAGSYTVIGTINAANFAGATTNTLAIIKASATATLGDLNSVYDGVAHPGTVSTTPAGLSVNLTYDGSPNAPTNAGSYTVIGTINDANFAGATTNTLTIIKAAVTATADDKSRAYGLANPPLTISYTGFANGDDASDLDSLPTASTSTTSDSLTGDYAITLAGGDDNNYTFNLVDGTLTITNALPVITFINVVDGVAVIKWTAMAGQLYRLQYKDHLSNTVWTDSSPDALATGETAMATNVVDDLTHRFYRVFVAP